MARHLPEDYPSAIKIILGSLGPPLARTEGNGIEPFHYLPHIIFVAERGLDHHDLSMAAQRELTRRFSCEFSIRAYLERDTERTLPVLARWTKDTDEHFRHLVSEGTRPRLPWAPRLKRFQADPFPVLALPGGAQGRPERVRAPLGRQQPRRHLEGSPGHGHQDVQQMARRRLAPAARASPARAADAHPLRPP